MRIKKIVLLLVYILSMTLFGNATELKRDGWNLMSICQNINADELDMSGIEEIQNQDGLSIYTGEFEGSSNLEKLEAGYGYWVKGSTGTDFDGGQSSLGVVKPLKREGWTLMAACEDINGTNIDKRNFSEIQSQSGTTIYIGEWESYTNLHVLENGYGYWVNGAKGSAFTAQERNAPPLADGGENQDISVGTVVTLDASLSVDRDGEVIAYEWKEGSTLLSNSISFSKSDFSVGTHVLSLSVRDNKGAVGTDEVIVVVASQANLRGVKTESGNIEVSLSWSDSSMDMDLEVDVPNGTMDVKDSTRLLEHFFSNNVTTVGSYAVRVKYKGSVPGSQKEVNDIMVNIKVPDSSEARVVNLKTIDALENGHIADIVITKDKIEFVPRDEFSRASTVIYEQRTSSYANDYVAENTGGGSGSWSGQTQYSSGWSNSVNTDECLSCEDDFTSKIIWNISQILLGGPVVNAQVEIYEVSNYDSVSDTGINPVYSENSSNIASIYAGGVILISKEIKEALDVNKTYVVKAFAGVDIDANSDSEVDSIPRVNLGTIHAVLTGRDIQKLGFKVNILTEMGYQLSKNLLAGDSEILLARLDSVSKMLLEEDMDASGEVDRIDSLKWVPYSDKQRLVKDFNVNFLPVIEKLQSGEDIYAESYALFATPIVMSSKFEVQEDAVAGTVLGAIPTYGSLEKPITHYTLMGEGAENFKIESNGTIKLSAEVDLDYEFKRIYEFTLVASNAIGDSPEVKLYIVVTADGSPILGTLKTFVFEDAQEGSNVGTISIDDKGNAITEMRLEGRDAKYFSISKSGVITLATTETSNQSKTTSNGTTISLEHKVYNFQVVGVNSVGESAAVEVEVRVSVATPKLSSFNVTITDNIPVGEVIGKLGFSEGSSPITSFSLSGVGVENFEIDNEGRITIAADAQINYATTTSYTLSAVAQNSSGASNSVTVSIRILSSEVADTITVNSLSRSIAFNTQNGTTVAKLGYSYSLHAPEAFTLSGEGSDDFEVDENGYIKLLNATNLQNKIGMSYNLKVVATSTYASSSEASVVITIEDDIPVLQSSNMSVMDGESNAEVLGKIAYRIGVSPIVSFALSGEGAENFSIDNTGVVQTVSNVVFDFKTTSLYNLTVTVSNELGRTVTSLLNIHVIKNAPVIAGATFSVIENTNIGVDVGRLALLKTGKGAVNFFTLYGEGVDKFAISKEGIIKVAKEIDYETQSTFTLQASANNAYDASARVDVTIRVINLADGEPVLLRTTFNVSENLGAGSEIGLIDIQDIGKNSIRLMTLSGIGKENFTVDSEGHLSLSSAVTLDYEQVSVYNLTVVAHNEYGVSESVDITINVENVVDNVPVIISPTVNSVREDVSIGYEVGSVTSNGTNIDENNIDAYTIVSGNTNGDFNISNEGLIYTLKTLDFERTESYVLVVQASNEAGESSVINVSIDIQDIVDIPEGFDYQAINNINEKVEVVYGDYMVKLYSDQNISADDKAHHIGVIVNVNGGETPLLSIQESYEGGNIVAAVYDVNSNLVGVSEIVVLQRRMVIIVPTVEE